MNPYAKRSAVLERLGYATYVSYLRGRVWRSIRARVLPAPCVCCGLAATQVHHAAYDAETMRGKSLDALMPVCRRCHRRAEQIAKRRAGTMVERLHEATRLLQTADWPKRRVTRRKKEPVDWTKRQAKKTARAMRERRRRAALFDPTPRLCRE